MVWKLTLQQVLESPEVAVLVFHNVYPEGKQGGLEILQHGTRAATNGDLRLEPAPGQWSQLPKVLSRTSNPVERMVTVRLAFEQPDISYSVRVCEAGEQIEVAVDLDRPLPEEWAGRAGFNLELEPAALFGKSYLADENFGLFPRQGNGMAAMLPLAGGRRLVVAPEDPLRRLEILSHTGPVELLDGRDSAPNGWFVVRTRIQAGAERDAVRWTIKPNRVPGWLRSPVILHSQVGYHPGQEKMALVELDPHDPALEECALIRMDERGGEVVLRRLPEPPVRFLRLSYARFDFSEIYQPGVYQLQYGRRRSTPFVIAPDVYARGVWQPTLETFLPVQMCHMRVVGGQRVWHGACHLDDALQAPPSHEHFDGYRQFDELETLYQPGATIPGLNEGGWHDAGDYDLAAGSQAGTTLTLALAREAFHLDSDQTTVNLAERLVHLHVADGVPDIIQQVAHGARALLGGYRASGHCFPGIIEHSLQKYVHLGDAATMTDQQASEDDRWVFTNRYTALEYQAAAALAAASRVLHDYDQALSEECLSAALQAWEYEHSHEPALRPVVYVWNQPDALEALAAVELLLATRQPAFARRLVELLPVFETHFSQLGWAAVRAFEAVADPVFAETILKSAENYSESLAAEMSASPFRLPFGAGWLRASLPDHNPFGEDYHPPIWGIGWSLQDFAVRYYFLARAFPDLFEREPLLRVLNYVLGCHPAGNVSLVSGVGAQSLTIAYGTNRAEWSYIPGGVASGPALLRPDIIELLDPLPWLWQQKEYVIGGAASYVFLVLAAQDLLA